MVFKVAQINKLEDGWEIKIGDGERADLSIFVENITILEGDDILDLEDYIEGGDKKSE